ncbi:MAG: hypothetical protein IPJ20_02915 [Flammeovirgaceae bacterium]|nr:hypothetical protein [Flammeovirgaceae bacterium]
MAGEVVVKLPNSTYPVNARVVLMNAIEGSIILISEVAGDTLRDGDPHPKYVDEDEEFVLHHTSQGDQKVVFNHIGACIMN